MEVKKVAIIGAGLMGSGIAYVHATAGYDVILNDLKDEFIENGINRIREYMQQGIQRGKISISDAQKAFNRIKTTTNLEEAVSEADIIIEAVFEDLNVKKDVFSRVDKHAPEHAIIASNTSTIPITKLADATNRPDKVIGTHFFSPVPAMKLLEIIITEKTSEDTLNTVKNLGENIGKEIVVCKDGPGFIVNRILVPTLNEIMKLYMEKIAPMDYLDDLFVEKGNFPMGPFRLADFVGLDIALHAARSVASELGPDYEPPGILIELVEEKGWKGLKSGKGFHDLPKETFPPKKSDDYILNRVRYVYINEGYKLLDQGLASASDIDKAMKLGTNFPKGPFELCKELGPKNVVNGLDEFAKELGEFYKPADGLIQEAKND